MSSDQATRAEFDPALTRCAICGSGRVRAHHVDFRGISVFKCRDCGVQFMNPQYTDRHLAGYYAGYIRGDAPERVDALRARHAFYLALIERYIRPGRLLDVGCGSGYLLSVAKERGWEPVGYDVDPATTRAVSAATGVPIRCGDFVRQDWRPDEFDCVTLHQVIEHVKNPPAYLETIGRILRPGGILMMASPNAASLSWRARFLLEKIGLRRRRVGAYYGTEHHLWYHSPASARRMLARAGFVTLLARSCHRAVPGQSGLRRFLLRNVAERWPWRSAFLVLAAKTDARA